MAIVSETLAAHGVKLPLRPCDEDTGVVLDAGGTDVFTVDVNNDRADESVIAIAMAIVMATNASDAFGKVRDAAASAPSVIEEIAAERRRQIEVEGWKLEHDDMHDRGELARAAACYARPDDISWTDGFGRALADDGSQRPLSMRELRHSWSYARALRWPWLRRWWKPKDARTDLVRAAALIVAEIERLDRASARSSSS